MFNVVNSVSGVVVLATSDLVSAEAFLVMIDTVPSSHEIVEVSVVSE